jgi:hypothetical protein
MIQANINYKIKDLTGIPRFFFFRSFLKKKKKLPNKKLQA